MRQFILVFFLCIGLVSPALAQMHTSAKQAVLIDMGTGMTLLAKNADARMPTSSMSKVMTAYVIFDAIEQGRIAMNTEFQVSEKAWKKGGSKMFIEVGEKVSVEELLKGLIVQSGNDASIALAEGLSGSEELFATAMTTKAHEIDMKSSNFKNASGWPDPEHYSTARDLALLAQRLIVDFPHEYALYSIKEYTYAGITQPNRNPLLYRNMGVDGIKTGHTEAGGYGLIASGENDGRRIVMVVNGLESVQERANESARLMSWAMNSFENTTIIEKDAVIEQAQTIFASDDVIPMTVARDIRITVPKGQKGDVKIHLEYKEPIKAPVTKGQELGSVKVNVPQIGEFTVPLVAAADLSEAGFMGRTIQKIKLMLSGS